MSLNKLFLIPALIILISLSPLAEAQRPAPVINPTRGKEMLQNVKSALKELYYDPAFKGMNVDERFKKAEQEIKAATSTWQINSMIAQVLLDLDDSHTSFYPPDLVVGVKYGFRMQMIGKACYITGVSTGGKAEAKGLKTGDLIYAIEGFEPTRESLWKIEYSYFVLQPPPTLRLTIQALDGKLREVIIDAEVTQKKRRKIKPSERSKNPPKYFEMGDDVIVCRLKQFDLNDGEVDEMMKRILTRKTLILDLRGNPGGYVSMEQRLLGYFFDKDIKIGDEKQRKKTLTLTAKTRGDKVFKGKVTVLVDSKSASAAEVFARVMQLEKRGSVIGDRTAGAVMTSVRASFTFVTGASSLTDPSTFYGANITVADLIMTDGKSLEKIGVFPDELLLPIGTDLAGGRDPVLSRAAFLAGIQIDPGKAGSVFPAEPIDEDEKTEN